MHQRTSHAAPNIVKKIEPMAWLARISDRSKVRSDSIRCTAVILNFPHAPQSNTNRQRFIKKFSNTWNTKTLIKIGLYLKDAQLEITLSTYQVTHHHKNKTILIRPMCWKHILRIFVNGKIFSACNSYGLPWEIGKSFRMKVMPNEARALHEISQSEYGD